MFVVLVLLRGALHCNASYPQRPHHCLCPYHCDFCLYLLCRLDHTNHQHIPQTSDKWWTDYPHARVRKKAGSLCFFLLLLLRPLAFRSRVGACRPLFQFLRFPKVRCMAVAAAGALSTWRRVLGAVWTGRRRQEHLVSSSPPDGDDDTTAGHKDRFLMCSSR